MGKSLSLQEEKEILKKIREEYKEFSKQYGKKVFDLDAFEDRLQFAIKKRISLENFFFAEIAALEKLKEKIEQKKKAKENSFLTQVDKMLADNVKKIAQYPDYDFHSKASSELKKLLGGLNHFLNNEFIWFEIITRLADDTTLQNSLKSFSDKAHFFVGESRRQYAPRIEDHILLLDRRFPDYSQIELDEKRFIKDIAIFLNELKQYLINLLYKREIVILATILKKEDLVGNFVQKIEGQKVERVVKKIIQKINQILTDFRIHDFKSN